MLSANKLLHTLNVPRKSGFLNHKTYAKSLANGCGRLSILIVTIVYLLKMSFRITAHLEYLSTCGWLSEASGDRRQARGGCPTGQESARGGVSTSLLVGLGALPARGTAHWWLSAPWGVKDCLHLECIPLPLCSLSMQ